MIVRDARESDLDRIAEIEAASFEDHRIARARFARMLLHASRPLCVAEDGGTVVGFVSVLAPRGAAEARIFSIAVDPAVRGRGAGAALLAAAEESARARGASSLRLEVSPENAAALALYAPRGFVEVRRWPRWYGPGRPAAVLRKTLG